MYCDRCGANLQAPARFCPQCGKQFGAALPPPAVANRVGRNLRTLAILWMVYSGLRLLPGLVLNSVDRWGIPFFGGAPYFVHDILQAVSGVFILTGVVGLVAGWGLLERQGWARLLAITVA